MCIRDRSDTDATCDHHDGALPVLEDEAAVRPVEYEQCTGCLLYTSDAADERSSVDLGGRRIIKKKYTKYHDILFRQSRQNSHILTM